MGRWEAQKTAFLIVPLRRRSDETEHDADLVELGARNAAHIVDELFSSRTATAIKNKSVAPRSRSRESKARDTERRVDARRDSNWAAPLPPPLADLGVVPARRTRDAVGGSPAARLPTSRSVESVPVVGQPTPRLGVSELG